MSIDGADLRPDLLPHDLVKFWRVLRWKPEGVTEIAADGVGQLGAKRIARRKGVGQVLRVHVTGADGGGCVEYVPLDAARWHDPTQLSIDVD